MIERIKDYISEMQENVREKRGFIFFSLRILFLVLFGYCLYKYTALMVFNILLIYFIVDAEDRIKAIENEIKRALEEKISKINGQRYQ